MTKEPKKKDYFIGSAKKVDGDIISHQSMRKFKRGHAQKDAEKHRRRIHHIQEIELEDGTIKTIYHDTEDFNQPKWRKQVDRAHRGKKVS